VDTFARALVDLPPLRTKLKPLWAEPAPEQSPKKACRKERLERMLEAATSEAPEGVVTLRWLVSACDRCGRCKNMPPPM
jgi:hypothetical protein